MKIDPKATYMDIKQLGTGGSPSVDPRRNDKAATTATANEAASGTTATTDIKVELSDSAHTVQNILTHLADLPGVDTAHVQRIKTAIDEGRYQPSAERTAAKLAQFEQRVKDKK